MRRGDLALRYEDEEAEREECSLEATERLRSKKAIISMSREYVAHVLRREGFSSNATVINVPSATSVFAFPGL